MGTRGRRSAPGAGRGTRCRAGHAPRIDDRSGDRSRGSRSARQVRERVGGADRRADRDRRRHRARRARLARSGRPALARRGRARRTHRACRRAAPAARRHQGGGLRGTPDPAAQPRCLEALDSRRSDLIMARPIIGITMGDAAGVGPEIIMKAMAVPEVYEMSRSLVIGDARRLRKAGEIVGSKLSVRPIQKPEEAAFRRGEIGGVDPPILPEDLPFGELSAPAGDAAFKFIQRAVELAMAGRIDGICTAPLNKEALHAGGHKYPGHTELFAQLARIEEVSMMLSTAKMRVIHVTTHIGLLDAIEKIEPALVERTIRRGYDALVRSGMARPRIAVCAINPHAGEGELFGRGVAETKHIRGLKPARARGRAR